MSDLSSESEMSSVNEACDLVQRVAEPRASADSVKALVVRAARRLGFSFTRTRDIWYRHARRIDAHEMDRLRETAARIEADIAINSVLALRRRLTETDEEFHRETISALDDALRAMGATVDPMGFRKD